MEKKDLRIVYMGTPDFAVESLKRLVEGGYNVVGVITMPDKPMGRHQETLQPSAVKKYAVEQNMFECPRHIIGEASNRARTSIWRGNFSCSEHWTV